MGVEFSPIIDDVKDTIPDHNRYSLSSKHIQFISIHIERLVQSYVSFRSLFSDHLVNNVRWGEKVFLYTLHCFAHGRVTGRNMSIIFLIYVF